MEFPIGDRVYPNRFDLPLVTLLRLSVLDARSMLDSLVALFSEKFPKNKRRKGRKEGKRKNGISISSLISFNY